MVNSIGGVMIIALGSSAVDGGFEPRSCVSNQSLKLVFVTSPLISIKQRLTTENKNNLSRWTFMSTNRLLFQLLTSTMQIQLSVLV